MTKLGAQRIHVIRGRGGNLKHRALRLDTGNFTWGTEGKISNFFKNFQLKFL
jgi:small subunit ribosomal protein S8e